MSEHTIEKRLALIKRRPLLQRLELLEAAIAELCVSTSILYPPEPLTEEELTPQSRTVTRSSK